MVLDLIRGRLFNPISGRSKVTDIWAGGRFDPHPPPPVYLGKLLPEFDTWGLKMCVGALALRINVIFAFGA